MILLDTHALFWFLAEPERLSAHASRAITRSLQDDGAAASDISLWEIAMLVSKGRIDLDGELKPWLEGVAGLPNFSLIRITPAIASLTSSLPAPFHGDPADRIIVATAMDRRIPLVTRDDRIRAYGHVKTIW